MLPVQSIYLINMFLWEGAQSSAVKEQLPLYRNFFRQDKLFLQKIF